MPDHPEPISSRAQLVAELERLRSLIAAHAGTEDPAIEAPAPIWDPHGPPSTPLDRLCALFELDQFERDVLLLCAGCELDAPFAALCRSAAVDPTRLRPTIGLALAVLPGARWSALAAHAPLRTWQLIRVSDERAASEVELTIDEAVLHYLLGEALWDARLDGVVDPLEQGPSILASARASAQHILRVWMEAPPGRLPLIQLLSPDPAAGLELVATLCAEFDAPGYRIDAGMLPQNSGELLAKLRSWLRLARIDGAIGVLDAASQAADQSVANDAIARWCEAADGPVILMTRTRRSPGARTWVTIELESPSPDEQREVWTHELAAHGLADAGGFAALIDRLVGTFDLSATRIRSACASARGQWTDQDPQERELDELLWQACRVQARPNLDAFAQRLDGRWRWSDLRTQPETLATLQAIAEQVRHRAQVHERWRVGGARRGQGISVLFSGPSGVGKTMAAELIGGELGLDVYRVDVSAVVSKYIGETEKNLARVFDAAEGSGVILLFDEADALFGKRSEVKDSHDRHANVEIGYLLQRMESYRGLAILTTNLREDLDQAFLRRLRFIVEFRHPSVDERRQLWERALGQGLPVGPVDLHALANLALTGAQIRNVVLNAAFAAAAAVDQVVTAERLREAIRQEYQKHGRLLSSAELERLGGP